MSAAALRLVAAPSQPASGRALARLSPDGSERGLLSVLRHLLISAQQPESGAWALAFAIATERWGDGRGLQIAAAATELVQALLARRQAPMEVADPLDLAGRERLSGDEEALFLMLRAMRQGLTPLARVELARLTSGVMDAALIRAGLGLARLLPPLSGAGVFQAQHPGLRLVQ